MYFRTSFPVPSLKHPATRFLHRREATRPCCCMPDVCCRSCLGCWRVSLKCWVGRSLNDSHQCTGTSPVCIRCMVLEIQLFLIHAFQKVAALCFRKLGPHKSRKNNCISRTMRLVQTGLVPVNLHTFQWYHWGSDPLNISAAPFSWLLNISDSQVKLF